MAGDVPPGFEIAHRTPGRLRLRWRGAGEPPPEVLAALRHGHGVSRVDYRPASGSVIVWHGAAPALPVPAPACPVRPQRVRPARKGRRWDLVVVNLEVLLIAALLFGWVRQAILRRALPLGTLLLLILTALNLSLYWHQHRTAHPGQEPDLEVLYF